MQDTSDQPGDSLHGSPERGGVIPGTRRPAYSLHMRPDMPIPVLLAVPHAGRDYPETITFAMRDPEYSKVRLEDRYVDRIARAVAEKTGAGLLISHAPRAMLDLNRGTEDVDWDMIADAGPDNVRHSAANRRARSGLGLIPRRLPGLGEIWNKRMTEAELTSRIRQIHAPYHGALGETLRTMRDKWGAVLLLDLHSMPPLKRNQRDEMPTHFVLGDRFGASASDRLVASAIMHFADEGAGVAHNRPYAGGYVLDRHAAPNLGVHAVQLEICRSRYLDAEMAETTPEITALSASIAALVRRLGEVTARISGASGLPLAAE